jgi:hypothetical protein
MAGPGYRVEVIAMAGARVEAIAMASPTGHRVEVIGGGRSRELWFRS